MASTALTMAFSDIVQLRIGLAQILPVLMAEDRRIMANLGFLHRRKEFLDQFAQQAHVLTVFSQKYEYMSTEGVAYERNERLNRVQEVLESLPQNAPDETRRRLRDIMKRLQDIDSSPDDELIDIMNEAQHALNVYHNAQRILASTIRLIESSHQLVLNYLREFGQIFDEVRKKGLAPKTTPEMNKNFRDTLQIVDAAKAYISSSMKEDLQKAYLTCIKFVGNEYLNEKRLEKLANVLVSRFLDYQRSRSSDWAEFELEDLQKTE